MPLYPSAAPRFRQAVLDPLKAGLRSLAQPTDDNVWKARLLGGLAGAGEGLLNLVEPAETDVMPDLTAGLAPVAGSMATRSLPQVAQEAYGAVKGLKGLYSRLTNSLVQQMPDRAYPSKIQSIAKSGSSAEEQSLRKLGDFLSGRDPNKVVEKADVLAHLEANPIELKHTVLDQEVDPRMAWADQVRDFEEQMHDLHGPRWQDRMTGGQLDEWNRRQQLEPPPGIGGVTQYKDYQVPGGERYQENLFQAPVAENPRLKELEAETETWRQTVDDLLNQHYEAGLTGDYNRAAAIRDQAERIQRDQIGTLVRQMEGARINTPVYEAPHFDPPDNQNLLLHVRANDRSLAVPSRNPEYDDLTRQIEAQQAKIDTDFPLDMDDPGNYMVDLALTDTPEAQAASNAYFDAVKARQALEDTRLKVSPTLPAIGSRGRLIEEIQSDLHQAGRKYGYTLEEFEAAKQRLADSRDRARERALAAPAMGPETQAADEAMRRAQTELEEAVARGGPVPDLPFKESYADLGLKQQLLDVAEDPDLEWLGILGPEEQIARFPTEKNIKGMRHFYGQEYPNKLAKLLKPFGGTVERTTLPRTTAPTGYTSRGGAIHTVEPSGQIGSQVASVWPPPNDPNAVSQRAINLGDLMEKQLQQGIQPPGPEAFIARLTPEMKEMIKKVGFPAMTALFGLRNAFSGQQDSQ